MNSTGQLPSRLDSAGAYRIKRICRHPDNPTPIIDVSPSTWWAGVKSGRFPKPFRNDGCTFWKGSDLLALVESMATGQVG